MGSSVKDYFFVHYKEGIPAEIASGTFTPAHFAVLGVVAVVYILLIAAFKNRSDAVRHKFLIGCSLAIVLSELIRVIWVLTRLGFQAEDVLPLHLCGLMIFFIPAAVITRKKLLMEFIYACGLAGAGAALFTPDVNYYPVFHFHYLQSFFIHGMIAFVPLFLVIAEDFRPDFRYLPKVFGLLLVMLPPIYGINKLTGANFFFLMEAPPGTLIEVYQNIAGYPGYFLLLLMTIAVLWLILYIPFMLPRRWFSKKSKSFSA